MEEIHLSQKKIKNEHISFFIPLKYIRLFHKRRENIYGV